MKRLFIPFFFGLFILLLASCYPHGADRITDYDVAMTHYDRNTDFETFSTFSMPDTIVYFTSDQRASLNRSFDKDIVDLVARNFTDLGYTRIPTPAEGAAEEDVPSFIVTISAFSSINYIYYASNWYSQWNWYWSWWEGFYPHYSPYMFNGYAYRSGTIMIEMFSTGQYPADIRDAEGINVVWTGIADGLLQGSGSFLKARIYKEIDQCFMQSPYLQR